MEIYLMDKSSEQKLFNCSAKQQQPISWEQIFAGGSFLVVYVILMILYLPCIWAMCISERRHWTSYKLMIQLGFTQIIGLQFAGLYTGIMTIWGPSFCITPDYEYIACCLVCAHWVCTTSNSCVLGINRLCELSSSDIARKLFGGWRLYIWMLFPFLYSGALFMFKFYIWMTFTLIYGSMKCWYLPSLVSNNHMMAALEETHSVDHVKSSSNTHLNSLLAFHNIAICVLELFINTAMIILYKLAIKNASEEFRKKMRYEKQIVVQVILIGLVNFTTSLVGTLIQLTPLSFVTTLIGTSGYLISQGIASVVYLTVNKSIRNTVFRKLGIRSTKVRHEVPAIQDLQVKSDQLSTVDSNVPRDWNGNTKSK